jgi:hypothetical protein
MYRPNPPLVLPPLLLVIISSKRHIPRAMESVTPPVTEEEQQLIEAVKSKVEDALKSIEDHSEMHQFWHNDQTTWFRYIRATEGNVEKAAEMIIRTAKWRHKIGINSTLNADALDTHFKQRKNYMLPHRDKRTSLRTNCNCQFSPLPDVLIRIRPIQLVPFCCSVNMRTDLIHCHSTL